MSPGIIKTLAEKGRKMLKSSWKELGVLTCEHCNLKMTDESTFQFHVCRKVKILPQPCKCTAGIHYDRTSGEYVCSLCNVKLPEEEFVEHLQCHLWVRPYTCKYCEKEFETRFDVYNHTLLEHSGYVEAFCLKMSKKTKELLRKAKYSGNEFYQAENQNFVGNLRCAFEENNASLQNSGNVRKRMLLTGTDCTSLPPKCTQAQPYVIVPVALPVIAVSTVAPGAPLIVSAPLQSRKSAMTRRSSVRKKVASKKTPEISIPCSLPQNSSVVNTSRGNGSSTTCSAIDSTEDFTSHNLNTGTLNSKTRLQIAPVGNIGTPKQGGSNNPQNLKCCLPVSQNNSDTFSIPDSMLCERINELPSSRDVHADCAAINVTSQSLISKNRDQLKAMKGYFLCIACKSKWVDVYQFLKHIWSFHTHEKHSYCCTGKFPHQNPCQRLKAVVEDVFDKCDSLQVMPEVVRRYLNGESTLCSLPVEDNLFNPEKEEVTYKDSLKMEDVKVSGFNTKNVTQANSVLDSQCSNLQTSSPSHTCSMNIITSSSHNSHINAVQHPSRRQSTDTEMKDNNIAYSWALFYKCGVLDCSYASHLSLELFTHCTEFHGSAAVFPCNYCGCEWETVSALLSHMDDHNGVFERPKFMYSCSLIDDSGKHVKVEYYSLEQMLERLKKCGPVDFTKDSQFVCNNCNASFEFPEKLEKHFTESLPLTIVQCRHCGGCFLDSQSCYAHMSQEHPLKSRYCRINKKLLCAKDHLSVIAFEKFRKSKKVMNCNVDSNKTICMSNRDCTVINEAASSHRKARSPPVLEKIAQRKISVSDADSSEILLRIPESPPILERIASGKNSAVVLKQGQNLHNDDKVVSLFSLTPTVLGSQERISSKEDTIIIKTTKSCIVKHEQICDLADEVVQSSSICMHQQDSMSESLNHEIVLSTSVLSAHKTLKGCDNEIMYETDLANVQLPNKTFAIDLHGETKSCEELDSESTVNKDVVSDHQENQEHIRHFKDSGPVTGCSVRSNKKKHFIDVDGKSGTFVTMENKQYTKKEKKSKIVDDQEKWDIRRHVENDKENDSFDSDLTYGSNLKDKELSKPPEVPIAGFDKPNKQLLNNEVMRIPDITKDAPVLAREQERTRPSFAEILNSFETEKTDEDIMRELHGPLVKNNSSKDVDGLAGEQSDSFSYVLASKESSCTSDILSDKQSGCSSGSTDTTENELSKCVPDVLNAVTIVNKQPEWSTLYDVCGMEDIDKHLKALYKFSNGEYRCKSCDKGFALLKMIHCHVFFCQGKVGVVLCPHCSFQDADPKCLTNHIKNQHKYKETKKLIFTKVKLTNLLSSLCDCEITASTLSSICASFTEPSASSKKDASVVFKEDHQNTVPTHSTTHQFNVSDCKCENQKKRKHSFDAGLGKSKRDVVEAKRTCHQNKNPVSEANSTGGEKHKPHRHTAEVSETKKRNLAITISRKDNKTMEENDVSSLGFECSLCNFSSYSYTVVKKHLANCHPGFSETEKVKQVETSTEKPVAQIYKCRYCPLSCEWNKDLMEKHVKEKHNFYVCNYCKSLYHLYAKLINHLKYAHQYIPKTVHKLSVDSVFSVQNDKDVLNDAKFTLTNGSENPAHVYDHESDNPVIEKCAAHSKVAERGRKQNISVSRTVSIQNMNTEGTKIKSCTEEFLHTGTMESPTVSNLEKISANASQSKRETNVKLSIQDYPYRCFLCNCCLKSISNLQVHFKWLHPKEDVKFIDRQSQSVYLDNGRLLTEKKKLPVDRHLCGYCPFRSVKRGIVEDHLKGIHGETAFAVHLHIDEPESDVSNSIQSSDDAPNEKETEIERTRTTQPTAYRCHICDALLNNEFFFKLHLAKHEGFSCKTTVSATNGLLICSSCGYIASSGNDLAQHTDGHIDERKYACSICEADSHTSKGIVRHVKKAHRPEEGAKIINRWKIRSSVNIKPKLVNLDPCVSLVDPFKQRKKSHYLKALLIQNQIKVLDMLFADCSNVLDFNNELFYLKFIDTCTGTN